MPVTERTVSITDISDFYLDVCEWKVENGDIATDWTPAPEDMMQQSEFNTFKASYEQSAQGWNAKLSQIDQDKITAPQIQMKNSSLNSGAFIFFNTASSIMKDQSLKPSRAR